MFYPKIRKLIAPRLLATVLAAACLWSCDTIYDDTDDCRMYLRFKYDYNMEFEDQFADQCDKVEVFLFDASGVLVRTITESGEALAKDGYRIELPIWAGDYTAMAWVGCKGSYDLTDMVVGESTKEELILKMNAASNSVDHHLEPLWFGTPVDFTYTGDADHTETIDLVRNTNLFNITLQKGTAIDPLVAANLALKITAQNGTYDSDNHSISDQTITYLPFNATSDEATAWSVQVSTLRLLLDQNVTLSIVDRTTGQSVIPQNELDLIPFLLMTKPAGMGDQEYLDRRHVWNLDFFMSEYFVAIQLSINGWVVWVQEAEL